MELIVSIIAVVGLILFLYWFFILKKGNLGFWKLANKHPDEAYDFFKKNAPVWLVDDEDKDYIEIVKKDKENWSGPFRLYVPRIGKYVKIYGRVGKFEEEQKKFEKQIKSV